MQLKSDKGFRGAQVRGADSGVRACDQQRIPWPFRLRDWVAELLEAKASSVTVADCAAALLGKSKSAAARTENQRILVDRAIVFLITSPSGIAFISVLLHEIPQLKLSSACGACLRKTCMDADSAIQLVLICEASLSSVPQHQGLLSEIRNSEIFDPAGGVLELAGSA